MSTESVHVDNTSLIYNWGIEHVEPLTRRGNANDEKMPLCIDMTHVHWESIAMEKSELVCETKFETSEAQYETRDTLLHKHVKTHQSDHNEIQNHHNSNCKIQSMREKQQNTSILSTADCKEVSYLDKHSRTGRSRLISTLSGLVVENRPEYP